MRRPKIRKLGIALLALTLLTLHDVGWAADLVAVMDLKFIRETDEPAVVMCFGERDEDCVVWARLKVYEARIRKIISGIETRKRIIVTYGRHALGNKNLRGVIAAMRKLEPEKPTDPQYQIIESGHKREMFCFDPLPQDADGFELKKEGEHQLTCYDTEKT